MARTYPLNPVDKIKNFLDRDEHVENDMDAILDDPDALAVNALTAEQLADELKDIQPRVNAKIALVSAMVGADEPSVESDSQCVRDRFADRHSFWPPRVFFWVRNRSRARVSRTRSPQSVDSSKVFRNYAHSVTSMILCATAVIGVFLYQKYSHVDVIRAEEETLQLRKLADAVERLSSRDKLLSAMNATLRTVEMKTAAFDRAILSSSLPELERAYADQPGKKLADAVEKLASQEQLLRAISATLRSIEMKTASAPQAQSNANFGVSGLRWVPFNTGTVRLNGAGTGLEFEAIVDPNWSAAGYMFDGSLFSLQKRSSFVARSVLNHGFSGNPFSEHVVLANTEKSTPVVRKR